jgi:hypothetical protein
LFIIQDTYISGQFKESLLKTCKAILAYLGGMPELKYEVYDFYGRIQQWARDLE